MSGKRLLIVDDDVAFCDFVREVAVGMGHEVETASNHSAFISAFRRIHPTDIVLDLAMPDVDGIELLKFLADEQCVARITIVSGFGEGVRRPAESLGSAYGLNLAGSLQKPVRLAELRALLGGRD